MLLNATKQKCLDYRYSKMIRELRNVTWTSEQAEGGNTFKLIAYEFNFKIISLLQIVFI